MILDSRRPSTLPSPAPVDTPNLVELDRDHPGFRDRAYRERRDTIARIALGYRRGQPVPDAPYSEAEHGVWRTVWKGLRPVHRELACAEFLEALADLALPMDRIPQLREVNALLAERGPFRMLPVAGLITARDFFRRLADAEFLSTQYIRHESTPLYTPEPDIVHELVGHAASLAHPEIGTLTRTFGEAARRTDDPAKILELERVYWYAMEFGVVLEEGQPKAIGAGLLSSYGELARIRDWPLTPMDPDVVARTPYDPTDYQDTLFVAPSFREMMTSIVGWLDRRFG